MKKIYLFILLCVLGLATNAQNWTAVTLPNANGYLKSFFIDAKTGFLAGDNGSVLKTTDSAKTFSSVPIPQTTNLWGVLAFQNGTTQEVHVVGDNGTYYKSVDGGTSWASSSLNYTQGFAFDITTAPNGDLFICGGEGTIFAGTGVIVKSTDGGTNWIKTNVLGVSFFDRILFTSPTTAYAVGLSDSFMGTVHKTTDGGNNWIPVGTMADLVNCIYCFDDNNCFVADAFGTIYKTTNGGTTWTNTSVSFFSIQDIMFINSTIGYAVSDGGEIYETTDGGTTWSLDFTGTNALWHLFFNQSSGDLYTVGNTGQFYKRSGLGVSISENNSIQQAKLYPNPLPKSNALNVNLNTNATLVIYTINGQEVNTKQLRGGDNKIDLSDLNTGLYSYTIQSEQTIIQSGKLIIE